LAFAELEEGGWGSLVRELRIWACLLVVVGECSFLENTLAGDIGHFILWFNLNILGWDSGKIQDHEIGLGGNIHQGQFYGPPFLDRIGGFFNHGEQGLGCYDVLLGCLRGRLFGSRHWLLPFRTLLGFFLFFRLLDILKNARWVAELDKYFVQKILEPFWKWADNELLQLRFNLLDGVLGRLLIWGAGLVVYGFELADLDLHLDVAQVFYHRLP
jgi:hypothetical protein